MGESAAAVFQAGREAFNRGDYAGAAEQFIAAVNQAEHAGDVAIQVESLSMAARSYLIRGLKEEGRPYIQRAAAIATPEQPQAWSRYLGVKGRFEWQDNDLAAAKATFTQWYAFCDAHAMHQAKSDAIHMIAIVVPPQEQVEWHLKGIALTEQVGGESERWLGPMWNNLGWTYFELKRYDEAHDALLKARTYHYKHSGDIQKVAADIFVGRVLRVMGRLEEAKAWIGDAFKYAEQLVARTRDGDTCERLGNCYEEFAEIDAAEGRSEDALQKLKRSRELLAEANAAQWGPDELKRLDNRIAQLSDCRG